MIFSLGLDNQVGVEAAAADAGLELRLAAEAEPEGTVLGLSFWQ